MKIVHISDVHVENSTSKFEKLFEKLEERYSASSKKPVLVISGDLVENGFNSEMKRCKKVLDLIQGAGYQMLICPGNHDLKKKGFFRHKGLQLFDKMFRPYLNKENLVLDSTHNLLSFPLVHNFDGYYFVGIDSNKNKRSARGLVGRKQLKRLSKKLDQIDTDPKKKAVVVYIHHDPSTYRINLRNVPGRNDFKYLRLDDRYRFRSAINNRVDVLLYGHVHNLRREEYLEGKYNIQLAYRGGDSIKGGGSVIEIDLSTMKSDIFERG